MFSSHWQRSLHWNPVCLICTAVVISFHYISLALPWESWTRLFWSEWMTMLCWWGFCLVSLILFLLMFPFLGMHVGLYAGLQAELWQLCWWILTRQNLVQLQAIILQVIHLDTEYPACSFYASTWGIALHINLTLLPARHYYPFLHFLFLTFFPIILAFFPIILYDVVWLDLHLKTISSMIPPKHSSLQACHAGQVVIHKESPIVSIHPFTRMCSKLM